MPNAWRARREWFHGTWFADWVRIGGSAAAAGNLVEKLGGAVMGYIFILELDFLKGRDKLGAPVYTLLASQEEKLTQS